MDEPGSAPREADYAEMAADAEREAEAREWIDGVLLDPDAEEAIDVGKIHSVTA